ncbi:MAG: hypothetical protein WDN45_18775 [Caulobacteraceae bacterium]
MTRSLFAAAAAFATLAGGRPRRNPQGLDPEPGPFHPSRRQGLLQPPQPCGDRRLRRRPDRLPGLRRRALPGLLQDGHETRR